MPYGYRVCVLVKALVLWADGDATQTTALTNLNPLIEQYKATLRARYAEQNKTAKRDKSSLSGLL